MVEPGWRKEKNHLKKKKNSTRSVRSKIVCNAQTFDPSAANLVRTTEWVSRGDEEKCWNNYTYIDLGIDDVDETSKNDNEVENVPSVAKVVLQLIGRR